MTAFNAVRFKATPGRDGRLSLAAKGWQIGRAGQEAAAVRGNQFESGILSPEYSNSSQAQESIELVHCHANRDEPVVRKRTHLEADALPRRLL
jgi:hypothetical protein